MRMLAMIPRFMRHGLYQLLTGKKPKPLPENTPAPEFEIEDESGNLHRLSQYRGKNVVLWFFIRAETPG